MVIPFYDFNELRTIRAPIVTRALIGSCVLIFLVFQSGLVIDANYASVVGFGMVPAEFPRLRENSAIIPEPLTVITYMFVHGGWMHLFGNMLFLWVFGDNVEDAMGHARFLAFYLLAGIAGGLAHAFASPESQIPLVGASGAIAGVVAAYVILYPRVKLWVLLLMRLPIKIAAVWAIGGWLAFQFANVLLNTELETAWWAHIGGFAGGALLVPLMRRRGVPLFGPAPEVPTFR